MIKAISFISLRFFALTSLCIFITLQLGQADTASLTVTITHRSPIETLSASGDVTSVIQATVGTSYTLVTSNGQKVILQDTQGNQYRIALSSTDYTPAAPPASTPPPPATNIVIQAPSPSITNSVAPSAPVVPATVKQPVMSGSQTIQFTGTCPSPSQHSQYVRYDFDLNQEHFWLYVPSA